MTVITVSDAQKRLAEVITSLAPGQAIELTQQNETVARLTRVGGGLRRPRQPGSAIGHIEILAEDDEHLRDFQDYMP